MRSVCVGLAPGIVARRHCTAGFTRPGDMLVLDGRNEAAQTYRQLVAGESLGKGHVARGLLEAQPSTAGLHVRMM